MSSDQLHQFQLVEQVYLDDFRQYATCYYVRALNLLVLDLITLSQIIKKIQPVHFKTQLHYMVVVML